MTKISIIVPFLNAERHLAICLNSILASTLEDIEVLCVNDGSTDRSPEIAEAYAKDDSRVLVIHHQENRGPGAARNTGIEAARSPYVGSVDSDDWIEPSMFEKMLAATGGGEADIVECGLILEKMSGEIVWENRLESGRIDAEKDLDIFETMNPSFSNKIWKRSLFLEHDIWFPAGIYYEDLATIPRLAAKARDIRIVGEECLYHYIITEDSIMQSASAKHQVDYLKCFDILSDFLAREGLTERYRTDFPKMVRSHTSYHAEVISDSNMEEDDKTQYIRHLVMMTEGYLNNWVALAGLPKEQLRAKLGDPDL